MLQVIHIEAPDGWPEGSAVIDRFDVEPGESLKQVFDRLGVSARIEEAPAKPRKLDPRAERFIAEHGREEADSVLAIYWRYHSLEAEEFDTAEEAERFLDTGAEYGDLAGEAVVVGNEIRVRS